MKAAEQHPVVSHEEWLKARKEFLAEEKKLTHFIDDVSARRRALPWEKIEKDYVFEGPDGKQTLAELFDGRSQLFIYHFMYGPGWKEGCSGCSFLCDHIDGANLHLAHHDVTLIAVSRAPWQEFQSFKKRMNWHFKWMSSHGSDFNYDFHVSFTDEQIAKKEVIYNFDKLEDPSGCEELPGMSIFYKDDSGVIFHTYSGYARAGDILIGTHNFLDLTPKGRNESDTMNWVRHHDKYDSNGSR